jgi:hypothetical protein
MRNAADISSQWIPQGTHIHHLGCHLGIVSAYILHSFFYAKQDRQAWLQRFLTAVTSINLIHAPILDGMKTDWPVYKLWQLLMQLRREPIDVPGALSMPPESSEKDQ